MNVIYAILLLVVFLMWGWSAYLQRELTVNNVTLNVGDSFTWVLALILGVGVSAIVASNVLAVQGWKVFIFLICLMMVDVVMLWLTATWVHATASHKIPLAYRLKNKKRENISFGMVIFTSIALLLGVLVSPSMELVVLIFMLTPVMVLMERTVSLKKRIYEIAKFEPYTEEEVRHAEDRLREAIEEGKVLQPKENIVQKIIKRERRRYKQLRNKEKMEKASENMEDIKRKNDELHKEPEDENTSGKKER